MVRGYRDPRDVQTRTTRGGARDETRPGTTSDRGDRVSEKKTENIKVRVEFTEETLS